MDLLFGVLVWSLWVSRCLFWGALGLVGLWFGGGLRFGWFLCLFGLAVGVSCVGGFCGFLIYDWWCFV